MKLIDNIKQRLGESILHKKVKLQKRQRAFFNFDTARSVGIIFDATIQDSYLVAKSFMASLRRKKIDVYALGYVKNQEAIAYFPYHKGIDFFSIKNTNWHYKPSNPSVDQFYTRPFDMLIDLSLSDQLQLKYIIGLSKAKFKLGRDTHTDNFYDFVIRLDKHKSLEDYIEIINHYMSVIKNG